MSVAITSMDFANLAKPAEPNIMMTFVKIQTVKSTFVTKDTQEVANFIVNLVDANLETTADTSMWKAFKIEMKQKQIP